MRLTSRLTLVLCAPVLALACSSKDDGAGLTEASFAARFELPASGRPEFLSVPFPSALQLNEDGTIALGNDALTRLVPKEKGAAYIVEGEAIMGEGVRVDLHAHGRE